MTAGGVYTGVATLPGAHRDGDVDGVNLARIADRCKVLGPGVRCVVWVQGCALRCRGCVVPESHQIGTGTTWSAERLAARVLAAGEIGGVTFSGGEPFLQAGALADTIATLRRARPELTFMSYTGYRREVLARRGTTGQRRLLDGLDILIDGPFVERLAGDLLWRGSSNQRIHGLTRAGRRAIRGAEDGSAGVEMELGPDGRISWTGIPPAGFRHAFEGSLARAGLEIILDPTGSGLTQPQARRPA